MKTMVFLPQVRTPRTVYLCYVCGKSYPNIDGIVSHVRKTKHMEPEPMP
jgi:hypothetical protein